MSSIVPWIYRFIFSSLIVDLFVWIHRFRVNWSWNLSYGVIANFLWDLYKPYIRIWFPRMFVEGCNGGCNLGVRTCLHQLISLVHVRSSSDYSFGNSFVYCWLVCIIFILSAFIDPETCSWVCYKIVIGTYTNLTYGFDYPVGLWKVVSRVLLFVM